jgi:hypothetical protein
MGVPWRAVGIFISGAALGAAGGGWAVYENADALQEAARPRQAALEPMRQEAPCPGAMTLPASANDDASFQLIDANAGHKPSDVHAFIRIGKEAAASGRPRDAELAFIMACRVASRPGTDPVLLADAKYQLARHFDESAAGRDPGFAKDLRRRARVLYGDSVRIYAVRLGDRHEKTNFASNALANLDTPAASEMQPPVVASARANDTRISGAAAAPTPAPAATPAQRPRPSFDCTKAHSRTEKLICSDAQLSQLDRELGKLFAQAKAGASNPADFRRRSDAQWKMREEQCTNRECLLAWYAQRRTQLLGEIDRQRTQRHASAR